MAADKSTATVQHAELTCFVNRRKKGCQPGLAGTTMRKACSCHVETNKTGQDQPGQGKTTQGKARQDKARQDRAGQGTTEQGRAGAGTWSDSWATRSSDDGACMLAPSPEAARTVIMSTPPLRSTAPVQYKHLGTFIMQLHLAKDVPQLHSLRQLPKYV